MYRLPPPTSSSAPGKLRIRPEDLPSIRSEVHRQWTDSRLAPIYADKGILATSDSAREFFEDMEMWHVTEDASDLIAQAAGSLPDDVGVDVTDVHRLCPRMNLLVALAAGIETVEWTDGQDPAPIDLIHISFNSTVTDKGALEYWLCALTYSRQPDGRLMRLLPWNPTSQTAWRFGDDLRGPHFRGDGSPTLDDDGSARSQIEDRRIIAALFALAGSERVIDSSLGDRSQRRRIRRATEAGDPEVTRVLDLRHSSRGSRRDAPSVTMTYKHRWIVDGHWRSQPYGPGRSRRKPVWIAPHLKGPDGAPMLTGEKVKVVRR